MKKIWRKWTEKETNFLKNNYYDGEIDFLIDNLNNRTWSQIKDKAKHLKIRRKSKKLSDISTLLEDSPEAYYWVGFLMADGSFTENRVALGVSKKDIKQLMKYKKFIKSVNKIHKMPYDYYQVRSVDANNVRKLRKKFNITNRKTYEPCEIDSIKNKDLMLSLVVGIIDGDGSITKRKDCNSYRLSFSLHPSWLANLNYIKKFLYEYLNKTCLTKMAFIRERKINLPQDKKNIKKTFGIAEAYIDDRKILFGMKEKAIKLGIPFMKRKLGQVVI